jgi:NAD(P)-dependent dehydrogenase (short-subunit alcohol dehydrogenase family)
MLNDKAAIVIGAVSGIGLGIVRALAQAGCNIMLNGFCEPAAIEHRRPQIKKDFGVRTAFNPADAAKPADVAATVESTAQNWASTMPASSTRHRWRSSRSTGADLLRGATGRRRLPIAERGDNHEDDFLE